MQYYLTQNAVRKLFIGINEDDPVIFAVDL